MSKSCYGCFFEVNSKCYWFFINKKEAPKTIPSEIINVGCNKYKNNNQNETSELIEIIINKFDGEIIRDKYKPPIKKRKTYKKKYVKSPHNYAYRRDAQ